MWYSFHFPKQLKWIKEINSTEAKQQNKTKKKQARREQAAKEIEKPSATIYSCLLAHVYIYQCLIIEHYVM